MRRPLCATLLALTLVPQAAGGAEGAPQADRSPPLAASATYRVLSSGLSPLVLDDAGTLLGQRRRVEQRLRILTQVAFERPALRFELGADLFSGQIAGDTTSVGARFVREPRDALDAAEGFEPRRAMLAWRTRLGELRLGHQTSDWGYGILANNGERELDFGDARLGDLVERAAFVTMPAQDLYAALAVDLVYRDSNARLVDGDRAMNTIVSLFLRRPRAFAGLYAAFREQWDDGGDRLEALALDAHARIERTLKEAWRLEAGFEGMLLFGSTTRIRPEPDLDAASILSGGAVVRGRASYRPWRVTLTVEAGWASGDNDRNDDTVRHATFHPDYRVGLILFQELLDGLSARAADRLADPAHVAQPPSGTAFVPSNGGVQNAFYLWPRVTIEPLPEVVLCVGLLHARAVADVIDPYSTNVLGGGFNRNYFGGAAAERDLGLELELGARYRLALPAGFTLAFGVEWARLFPGAAFRDAQGVGRVGQLDRVIGRALVDWSFR